MNLKDILEYEKMFERDLELETDMESKHLINNILYDLERLRNLQALGN